MPQVISRSTFLAEPKPWIVGAISSPDALATFAATAAEEQRSTCDIAELRLDLLGLSPSEVRGLAERLHVPLLLTARHPEEGGKGSPLATVRAAQLIPLLDLASLIDIELRSLPELSDLAQQAQQRGITVVGSFHDFQRTPPEAELNAIVSSSADLPVDVVKLALRLADADDLLCIARLLSHHEARPLSVMGMGDLGKVSRLLLAKLGSRLTYGFIGSANAPGQWPARELKQLVAAL